MAAGDTLRRELLVRRIRRVQRRLNSEVWLSQLWAPLWCGCLAAALWRFFVGHGAPVAAGVSLLAAGAVWVVRARPRLIRFEQAAVLADRGAQAGGLLLSRLEVPVGEWELSLNERMRTLKPPEVKRLRSASAVFSALLFLIVAMAVPLPQRPPSRVNAAAASKLAQVEAKALALALEEPLGESLEEELSRLREELADGRFDAADWEAADGVESALEQKAAEAASELSRASEAARALEEALSSAQGKDSASREREELESSLMALADGKASGEPRGGTSQEGQPGREGQQGQQGQGPQARTSQGQDGQSGGVKGGAGNHSRAQVSELRRALEERQQKLASAYGQARGQGSPRQAGRGGQQRGGGRSGQCPGGAGASSGQCQGGAQGDGSSGQGQSSAHASRGAQQGGPSRGGGAGELVFGEWAEMNPDRLKFEPLPQGQGGEGQELWGLRAADPVARAGPSGGGVGGAAGGEQAPGHKEGPLLPRNRELTKRYFDSPGR
ncbi:MAG: hypothetical protein HYZ28_09530 [Myxococcales bacterium]|nr:hypothetical protein [Myxococcales bacterium]